MTLISAIEKPNPSRGTASPDTGIILNAGPLDVLSPGIEATAVNPEPRVSQSGKGGQHPSVIFLAGSLAGGNLVSMILRMAGGILQARLVAPATLGLFNGIGLVLGYAPFLQLGILSGLNRELPFYVGKGDHQRVKELAAAAQAYALAVGSLVFFVLTSIACWQFVLGEHWTAAGWFTNAVLALPLFYNTNYLQLTFRTSHDFARLALAGVVESGVGFILLILVAWFSFYGLCLRSLLASALGTFILYLWRPIRIGPKWNNAHLRHLLVIGAPILGVGILYTWWGVINSTLVLQFAGTEGLGLYSLVVMASSALEILPTAVAQVVYPRMSEQYGRSGCIHDLFRLSRKPTVMAVAGMLPLVLFGWFMVGPVVHVLMPGYEGAVPAIRWGLLIPLMSCFTPVNSIFVVVRRQYLYAAAILIGISCNVIALLWMTRAAIHIEAFPQSMLIGRVSFLMTCYFFLGLIRGKSGNVDELSNSDSTGS